MDIWERERALARTTVVWGVVSAAVGLGVAATTRDPWWRSFGLQSAGWGGVDVAIAVVGSRLQHRRMRRLSDPDAPSPREAERVRLRRVLLVNAAADVGYVALGAVLTRDSRARVAGAGAAILVQGAFLLVHDSVHAAGAAPTGEEAGGVGETRGQRPVPAGPCCIPEPLESE